MNPQRKNELLGAALTLGGGFCWAVSGCCGQFLFTQKGMTTTWLVPLRLFVAGVLLLGWCALRQGPRQVLAPWRDKRDRGELLVYGLFGITLCQFFYFDTIRRSNAGVGTILQDLSPLFILLCTCWAARRLPRRRELLSILLALAGVLLLVTHGSLTELAVSPAALCTGVLSAVGVTVYNVQPKRLLARWPVPLLQGWAFLMGGLVTALLFRPWAIAYTPDAVGLLGVGVCVVVGNLMAFTLYMQGVKRIGPAKGVLYGFSEPVGAALLSCLFLGSRFTLCDLAGFACVLAMVCLISRPEGRPHAAKSRSGAPAAAQTR